MQQGTDQLSKNDLQCQKRQFQLGMARSDHVIGNRPRSRNLGLDRNRPFHPDQPTDTLFHCAEQCYILGSHLYTIPLIAISAFKSTPNDDHLRVVT